MLILKMLIGLGFIVSKFPLVGLIILYCVYRLLKKILPDVKEESPTGRLVKAAKDWQKGE